MLLNRCDLQLLPWSSGARHGNRISKARSSSSPVPRPASAPRRRAHSPKEGSRAGRHYNASREPAEKPWPPTSRRAARRRCWSAATSCRRPTSSASSPRRLACVRPARRPHQQRRRHARAHQDRRLHAGAHQARAGAQRARRWRCSCAKSVPVMRRQKSGNVINVSSIAARHGGGGGAILYAGAKGFISTVTHGWAKEWSATGFASTPSRRA